MGERLGRPVVVEGRPGAGGNIASSFLARGTPDGYLMGLQTGSHAVNAAFGRVRDYDPVDAFDWISIMVRYAFVLVVRADHPARDLRGLLAMAAREPGAVQFGSGGIGSSHHFTGELINATAGVQMTHVPYRGDAAGLTAVLTGELPVMVSTTVGAIPHLQDGRMRGLAVTASRRSPRLPDVPTFAEAGGFPGFQSYTWAGLAAPKGVPPAILARLHAEMSASLAQPALRQRLEDLVDGEVDPTPQAATAGLVRADIERWRGVMRLRGIAAE
jgi:tripartite-type tricarboxylate transporter receptor subunit TctC